MRRVVLILLMLVSVLPDRAQGQNNDDCPPQATESLAVGSRAVTPYEQPLYPQPLAPEPIGTVPLNTVVTISEAPVCTDNIVWWKIEADDQPDLTGWIAMYYWIYEQDGQTRYHSDPALLPYVEVDGFERREMPADAVLALGFSTGGAGGGFLHDEDCLWSSRLYDDLGSLVAHPIFGVYDSCDETHTPSIMVDSGDMVTITAADLSVTYWYRSDSHVPAICYQAANTIIAQTPNGEIIDAYAPDEHPCHVAGYEVAQLPPSAYHQLGTWQLRVDDYYLNIEVPVPEYPIFSNYTDADGQYTLWLGGFDPFERVVIFVGSPFTGTGEPSYQQVFEIQTDVHGYFVGSMQDQGVIFVAVGENGHIHWKGRCEGGGIYDEEDPNAACAERLYEYFWPEGAGS